MVNKECNVLSKVQIIFGEGTRKVSIINNDS